MRKFTYVISNEKGATKKGSMNAASQQDVADALREENNVIISITEESQTHDYFWQKPKLSFVEKMTFTKHLSTMLKVGITITEAIDILKDQAANKNTRRMYENILQMIQSGQTLSKSLQEYKWIFSDVFINMIAVGEESGTLEKTLGYLDKQLEKDYDLRKRVVSAFVYPAFIVCITLTLTAGIVVFVLPKIAEIFTSFDVVLPLPTRILIGTSNFVTNNPFITMLLLLGAAGLSAFMIRSKHLKNIRDQILLKLPIFGKLIKYINLARFSRIFNSLLQAGVPITKSLQITEQMITSKPYKKVITQAAQMIEKGGRIGESFSGHEKIFPVLTTRMLFVGEKTGSLESTTDHLASMYEQNVDHMTKNLSVLLEPILLIFMGMLVGGVAISVILPIYQLPNLLSR
ncbi:hypothetical protein COW94_04560 [Candidatus Peregrinibacteria bacterium CG22_combo_CG10-13_8_21_14_all_44_10]|nr:MAG: hypothetical protein AUK45_03765 [Candidatus Peregrinibacteria bacterium CG2_30_44_17]PIP65920.1 MAG: hypothetical protein COW94_04560 [Candidatus Peregrinibacteria bacterium CG22_combo_CG10-13_8_21_14_all_44_10]PIS04192.1 MAG: hypothetical protein COT83_01750 [Candidatus Peregrinibacteria bacterium CG10_big_fil_rev_8_21_14_0_10_44_7]PIX79770.1 MAG: hypothetical protein COZ35_02785 [Candidatus Peregrinibacteria bacterium CG_4_10_14_3_um_filter_44_21]PJB88354.1 MAG: hypothetical protein 